MSWKDRFRDIRRLADRRLQSEKDRLKQDKDTSKDVIEERKRVVRRLSTRTEKVCREFAKGVKATKRPLKGEEWAKGNFGWRILADFGGVEVGTWPWVYELSKPRILRGLWLHYVGPAGEPLVSESRVKGMRLGHYYELGREGANEAEYYYWGPPDCQRGPCFFGYFLPVKEFSEERLAGVLEEIGLDLVRRFTREDFRRVG